MLAAGFGGCSVRVREAQLRNGHSQAEIGNEWAYKWRFAAGVVAFVFVTWGSLMPENVTHAAEPKLKSGAGFDRSYDRPGANSYQSRSVIMARNGIVATSQPLAAQVGLDVLKAGGSAADAAIAANAVIGLTEPMSCGVGGDLFVIYWDAKQKKLYGLNASGRSPYGIDRAQVLAKGHTAIPTAGPLSWSVPGCVDGWEELRRRFGTKGFTELLKPAIDYAEQGFPVSEIIAQMNANGDLARAAVEAFVSALPPERMPSPIDTVLDRAIVTAPEARDPALLARLDAVAGRYLRES